MHQTLTRRDVIRVATAGATALTLSQLPSFAFAAGDAEEQGTVVPFDDPQPIDPKRPMLKWEDLHDWMTPTQQFFDVSHYGTQQVAASSWRLSVEGLVEKPASYSLDQIKSRPRQNVIATLECSGNGAGADFMGAIGNAQWTGARLADLLQECGTKSDAIEVAFWGADSKKETIRGNEYEQNFARALPLAEAIGSDVILAYEMNGQPLSDRHGFPLRLIVPGWYGIAWVKWLSRIELRDRRLMNRFMARDYVTIRGERHGNSIQWKESSVGPLNVKSLVGRVTRLSDGTLRITGAAWARDEIRSVELSIDNQAWVQTRIDEQHRAPHAWTFWSYDWKDPASGEHTLVTRAVDAKGHIQPSADDDSIKLKKTYWEANQQYPRRIRI